mgnify:CR=1 FL=1
MYSDCDDEPGAISETQYFYQFNLFDKSNLIKYKSNSK